MPKINVAKPFNFSKGGQVKAYKKGEQEVPADVAEHAKQRGYLVEPAKPAAPSAAPETPAK